MKLVNLCIYTAGCLFCLHAGDLGLERFLGCLLYVVGCLLLGYLLFCSNRLASLNKAAKTKDWSKINYSELFSDLKDKE